MRHASLLRPTVPRSGRLQSSGMKSGFLTAACMVLILSLGLGCARKPDDGKISSEIQSRFSQDSGLSSKQLGVQSANGVVTLSGTVDNDAQREAASRQAASVAGVKEVVNNLQVAAAVASAPQTPAAATPQSAMAAANAKPPASKKPRKSHWNDHAYRVEDTSPSDETTANNQPPADAAPEAPAAPAAVPASADNTPPPPPAPPAPAKFVIDSGTQVSVRLVDAIDSEKNMAGDTFHATLNAPLSSGGQEAVPAGADVIGHLVDVKSASKFAGQSMISMQLDSLSVGGKTYNLQTDQYTKQAASRSKNTAEKVGGGAVIGSIIGALAGGGKGAAIGAAAGAGVGGGAQAASKSQQIKLPPETVVNFTLQAPVTVERASNPNANRPQLESPQ